MNATHTTRVLLLAPNLERTHHLRDLLQANRRDDEMIIAHRPDEAIRKLADKPCAVAVVEGDDGLPFIEAVTSMGLNVAVILIAPDEDGDLIDKARVAGASDALFHSELSPAILDHAIQHALLWRAEEPGEGRQQREHKHADLLDMGRTESLARFVSGIAHEVRNPLSIIYLAADFIARPKPLTEDARAQMVKFLREGADRIENIMSGMLGAYAPKQLVRNPHDPIAVIEEALARVQPRLDETAAIQVMKEYGSALPPLLVDRNRMVEAIAHLLNNAIDAMPTGGTLGIKARVHTFTSSERSDWQWQAWFWAGDTAIIIEITDTGHGIPAAQLQHIYEAFFTTKPAGKGAGLGLTATKKIVELHSGRVAITNRPEGGAAAQVTLKTAPQPTT